MTEPLTDPSDLVRRTSRLATALAGLGLLVAGWFRFDQRWPLAAWVVVAALAGTYLAAAKDARHAIEPGLARLAGQPDGDAQLRTFAREVWRARWERLEQRGAGALAGRYAVSVFVVLYGALLAVLPPDRVPRLGAIPRAVTVFAGVAAVAAVIAVPLSAVVWRRGVRALRQFQGRGGAS